MADEKGRERRISRSLISSRLMMKSRIDGWAFSLPCRSGRPQALRRGAARITPCTRVPCGPTASGRARIRPLIVETDSLGKKRHVASVGANRDNRTRRGGCPSLPPGHPVTQPQAGECHACPALLPAAFVALGDRADKHADPRCLPVYRHQPQHSLSADSAGRGRNRQDGRGNAGADRKSARPD